MFLPHNKRKTKEQALSRQELEEEEVVVVVEGRRDKASLSRGSSCVRDHARQSLSAAGVAETLNESAIPNPVISRDLVFPLRVVQ